MAKGKLPELNETNFLTGVEAIPVQGTAKELKALRIAVLKEREANREKFVDGATVRERAIDPVIEERCNAQLRAINVRMTELQNAGGPLA